MKGKLSHPQTRLYLAAAITLLAGWTCAVIIYLTAKDTADDATISAFENSKAYRHDLELYGGKINVLADEFMRWFDGLWHGKALASTLAVITPLVAAGFFLAGYYLLHDEGSGNAAGDGKE
jgi:hypothetical protein